MLYLLYVNSNQLRYLNLADMTDERVFKTAEYGIKSSLDNWLLCDKDGRLAICAVNANDPGYYLRVNDIAGNVNIRKYNQIYPVILKHKSQLIIDYLPIQIFYMG